MLFRSLGDFSNHDLAKVLTGKHARANINFGYSSENISGSCSKNDFQTMLELLYLEFTAPRMSFDEFNAYRNKQKEALINAQNNPYHGFSDTIQMYMTTNIDRYYSPKPMDMDSLDYNRIMELYKQRTANCNGLTVCLVGNLNIDSIMPMVELYLGGLPSDIEVDTYVDREQTRKKGKIRNVYSKSMETPAATSILCYKQNSGMKYSPKQHLKKEMLESVLNQVMHDSIRDKESATYGVSVSLSESSIPKDELALTISTKNSPERRAEVMRSIKRILKQMADGGIEDDMLKSYKESLDKNYPIWIKNNAYWLNRMMHIYRYGFDMDANLQIGRAHV